MDCNCGTYDTDHKWEAKCTGCGEPVTMTHARAEAIGYYHLGCFGWPACSCLESHFDDNCKWTHNGPK